MARVVHSEMPADKPERAVEFYRSVFGWSIKKWDGPQVYWLATTGDKKEPGIDRAIMERSMMKTTVNTVEVHSLDESILKVKKAGGKQLSEKQKIPGVEDFCYCADTEGNPFGPLQSLPGGAQMG